MNSVDSDIERIVRLKRKCRVTGIAGASIVDAVVDLVQCRAVFMTVRTVSGLRPELRCRIVAHLKGNADASVERLTCEIAAEFCGRDVGTRQGIGRYAKGHHIRYRRIPCRRIELY